MIKEQPRITTADVTVVYPDMYASAYDDCYSDTYTVTVGGENYDEEKLKKVLEKKKKYDEVTIANLLVIGAALNTTTDAIAYDSYDDLALDVEMRYWLVMTMKMVEENNSEYNSGQHKPGKVYYHYGDIKHIDENFWEPLGEIQYSQGEEGTASPKFRFRSGRKLKPSDGVKAIFYPTDYKDVVLDCNSMMVAIQYYAMLKAYGDDKFNKLFPDGKGLIIGFVAEKGVTYPRGTHPDDKATNYPEYTKDRTVENRIGTKEHPFVDLSLYDTKAYANGTFKYVASPDPQDKDAPKRANMPPELEKELVAGDWVYFLNHPDYVNQADYGWTGEHALYLGDGKFEGFGAGAGKDKKSPGLTYYEVLEELQAQYNYSYKRAMHKPNDPPAKTIDEMPGITTRFRPKITTINNLD